MSHKKLPFIILLSQERNEYRRAKGVLQCCIVNVALVVISPSINDGEGNCECEAGTRKTCILSAHNL